MISFKINLEEIQEAVKVWRFPAPPEHSVEMGNGKWLNRGLCEVKGDRVQD